ncbi:MAG: adenosylmethionine-8-amino-7-oxononanoate aminotransferase [Mariprofundaceae bacterium]
MSTFLLCCSRGKALLPLSLLSALLLSACGYHLVGHGEGRGAIPEAVHSLSLVADSEGKQLLPGLRERLGSAALAVSLDPQDSLEAPDHARLIVQVSPASFTPSAFDASGIASQYRMVYAGSMTLEHNGRTIWQSGRLVEQGEVYVTGDPASIEASRAQLLRGLRKQWLQTAVSRLRSGF